MSLGFTLQLKKGVRMRRLKMLLTSLMMALFAFILFGTPPPAMATSIETIDFLGTTNTFATWTIGLTGAPIDLGPAIAACNNDYCDLDTKMHDFDGRRSVDGQYASTAFEPSSGFDSLVAIDSGSHLNSLDNANAMTANWGPVINLRSTSPATGAHLWDP